MNIDKEKLLEHIEELRMNAPYRQSFQMMDELYRLIESGTFDIKEESIDADRG